MSDTPSTEAPTRIFLQWHGDGDPDDPKPVVEGDVTWSKEPEYKSDVEYVRVAPSTDSTSSGQAEAPKGVSELVKQMVLEAVSEFTSFDHTHEEYAEIILRHIAPLVEQLNEQAKWTPERIDAVKLKGALDFAEMNKAQAESFRSQLAKERERVEELEGLVRVAMAGRWGDGTWAGWLTDAQAVLGREREGVERALGIPESLSKGKHHTATEIRRGQQPTEAEGKGE